MGEKGGSGGHSEFDYKAKMMLFPSVVTRKPTGVLCSRESVILRINLYYPYRNPVPSSLWCLPTYHKSQKSIPPRPITPKPKANKTPNPFANTIPAASVPSCDPKRSSRVLRESQLTSPGKPSGNVLLSPPTNSSQSRRESEDIVISLQLRRLGRPTL